MPRRSQKPSARARRDAELVEIIRTVRARYRGAHGVRKTWHELQPASDTPITNPEPVRESGGSSS